MQVAEKTKPRKKAECPRTNITAYFRAKTMSLFMYKGCCYTSDTFKISDRKRESDMIVVERLTSYLTIVLRTSEAILNGRAS